MQATPNSAPDGGRYAPNWTQLSCRSAAKTPERRYLGPTSNSPFTNYEFTFAFLLFPFLAIFPGLTIFEF
jgi:hypothetical protein